MRSSVGSLSHVVETVLAKYADMVRHVGRRHGLRDHDLDEVLQDVRIRLWQAEERQVDITSASNSYVYSAARSAALDLVRRRRAVREESLDDLSTDASSVTEAKSTSDAARSIETAEFMHAVTDAITEIPESRQVVLRMYLAGYDIAEIGALLEWSEPKTRNLLYRGLANLRERLRSRGIGPAQSD